MSYLYTCNLEVENAARSNQTVHEKERGLHGEREGNRSRIT